jgi:tetratricopeptide (TPR) repeat protein
MATRDARTAGRRPGRRHRLRGPWLRGAAVALSACAVSLSGCASLPLPDLPDIRLPGLAREPAAAEPGPDAPPDLDFLVGREHEMDGRLDEATAAYARALAKDPESVYLLKELAELSARQGRLDDALGYAERAFALTPDDEGVRLFLGTLYRMRKDEAGARRALLGADGLPVSPDAALLLYGVLADARRFEEARGVAEWLIEAEPEGLRGFFALADVNEKQGDAAAAEAALRRGLASHPGELALYGALARGRRERGDRDGEIEIYREALAAQPDHHGTLVALAEALLAVERTDEALEVLRRIEQLHPDDLRTLLRVAFLEFERGEFEAARVRFERALAAHPSQHEVAYFLGVTLRRLRRDDEAMAVFERIPEDHERFAEARTQIAALLEERDEFARAVAEVERARASAPSRPLDLYLASLRAKSGDVAGALAFLEGLLAEAPDDPELLYNIGVIHGEARHTEEAIRYMQVVLAKDPDHPGALNYLGYTWAERGTNLEQAEAMIQRALEQRPDDGYITDSLGWVYYMRARPLLDAGHVDEARALLGRAVEELERAAQLTGGDPVISEHLGDVYQALGKRDQALRMYEEAVRLEPRTGEQPDLVKKLERLRGELGRR